MARGHAQWPSRRNRGRAEALRAGPQLRGKGDSELGEGADPEVPLDDAFGGHGLVDEVAQVLGELEAGERALAADERIEEGVARGESLVEQRA